MSSRACSCLIRYVQDVSVSNSSSNFPMTSKASSTALLLEAKPRVSELWMGESRRFTWQEPPKNPMVVSCVVSCMFFVLALALFSPTLSPWRLNYTKLIFWGTPCWFWCLFQGGYFGKIVELTRTCETVVPSRPSLSSMFTGWFRSPMIQQGLLYQLRLVWVSAKTLYCTSN